MPIKYVNGVPTLYNWTQSDEDASIASSRAASNKMIAEQAEYDRNWRPTPASDTPVNPDTYTYYSPGTAPTLPSAPTFRAPTISGAPAYDQPNYKELSTYDAPDWDESKIESLTQKRAAVGLREAREQMQGITGRKFSSPQVMRMTLRDAMRGFGSAIDKTMGAASETAQNEYTAQYGRESENARAEIQSKNLAEQSFNTNLSDWAKTNYSGLLTGWKEKIAAEQNAANQGYDVQKLRYQSQLSDYEKQRQRYTNYQDKQYGYSQGA